MLAADGALSVDGKPVDTADFEAALDRATQAAPGSSLGMILQADSTVPYAQVVAIMERAKAAGVERISIAVEPRPDVNVPAAPEDPLP
jgi:biopolymer transport protein ExbD